MQTCFSLSLSLNLTQSPFFLAGTLKQIWRHDTNYKRLLSIKTWQAVQETYPANETALHNVQSIVNQMINLGVMLIL